MKDKEARRQINELAYGYRDLEKELGGLRVQYCPKCKHDTIQRANSDYGYSWRSYLSQVDGRTLVTIPTEYTCLVCGARLSYEKKMACHVIEEDKDAKPE